MSRMTRNALAFCIAAFVLVACDSVEDRAEEHYASAVELYEQGDVARARVELRNVLSLTPDHVPGRQLMAKMDAEKGSYRRAAANLLAIVEAAPDDLETSLRYAEFAILADAWEPADEVIQQIAASNGDDPRVQMLVAATDYRDALLEEDVSARRAAADIVGSAIQTQPENVLPYVIAADNLMLDGDIAGSLRFVVQGLERAPAYRRLLDMQLAANVRLEDDDAIEASLFEMLEQFPDDETIGQSLFAFYSSRNNLDGAEAFLRSRIKEGERDQEARVSLVQFILQNQGNEAAITQTDAFIEEGLHPLVFRTLKGSLTFDSGDRDAGIAVLQDLIEDSEPSDQIRQAKISLSQMLELEGNEVGARALIEEVLAEDPNNTTALIRRAGWLIQDDDPDAALLDLRRAVGEDPDRSDAYMLLTEAYLRLGQRELAATNLAQAVETSNRGIAESLAYARFLIADDRLQPAESVLIDSLRFHSGNVGLLRELGNLYVRMQDWDRAGQVERTLRSSQEPDAVGLADSLQFAILSAQQNNDEALELLLNLADQDGGNRGAEIAVVRAHLASQDVVAARSYIDEIRAEAPDDLGLTFVDAAVLLAEGKVDEAIALYTQVVEQEPRAEAAWMQLLRVQSAQTGPNSPEAAAVLDKALAALPESTDLLWVKASLAEANDDFEAAIAIYESIYERDTSLVVVANNLASLLSTYRTADEDIERARAISRRLQGTTFPPFQDTYGWIAYLNGEYEEALTYLEPAAQALETDPLVQFHLAATLDALTRHEEALAAYARALEIAGDDPRPQFEQARSRIAELQKGDTATPNE